MAQIVIMPKLGQTVEESTLLKWHKKAGDPVRKGEILFDIETDKAVLEVESFFEGTLLKILVNEGQTVPVTAPVAFVGKPGEPLPDVPAPAPAARAAAPAAAPSPAAPARAASALPAPGPAAAPAPAPAAPPAPSKKAVSPRARRLARECG
ncbi:MAG: dihydrolipoamide acetyltransferase, partial [Lentisphaerae bacterium]|nr:dihydrolipoamide acetyltransferase [Lentisphaerota bacterium]